MSKLNWHRLDRTIEDAWIVHIVPGKEQACSTLKLSKLLLPEVSCIFVQEVHEGRITWPSLGEKSLTEIIPHEYIQCIAFGPLRVLKLHGIGKDEVFFVRIDMRVNNSDKTAASLANFILHAIHCICCKVYRVEREPTIIACLDCFFISPESVFNVEPKDVNRESVVCEILAALSYHVSGYGCPLAELEA